MVQPGRRGERMSFAVMWNTLAENLKLCNPSVEGLIEEAREMIRATGDPEVLDTGLTLRVMRLQQHTLTINDAVVCTYNKILAARENERLDEAVNQKAFFIQSKTVH